MPAIPSAGPRPPAARRRTTLAAAALVGGLLCTASPALAAPLAAPAQIGTAVASYSPGALPAEDRDRLRDSGIISDVPSDVPAPPELPATSYLLADLSAGDVLVAKGAHDTYLPASTMKLLTAQTLLPRLRSDQKIAATDSDARVDGTRVGMVPGREYTADTLFHALLMGSANDAAEALARANGGLESTLKQMTERAAQLGAKDTVPKTPHGLDDPDQKTSAYDLVAILRGALDTPQVAAILTTQTSQFPKYAPVEDAAGENTQTAQAGEGSAPKPATGPSLAGVQQVASQNKLLWNYDGAIGGKDGYTDAAGHTYVGAVKRGDKTYAVAFMGATSNDWKPMAGLLDWAFANGGKAKAVGTLPGAAAPIAALSAPAASNEASTGGGLGGVLAAIGQFFLTLLKILLWTVVTLGAAVVGLRVRKLRRDARRHQARRARLAAAARADAVPRPVMSLTMVEPRYAVPGDEPAYVVPGDEPAYVVPGDEPAYVVPGDGPDYPEDQAFLDDPWAARTLGDERRRSSGRPGARVPSRTA